MKTKAIFIIVTVILMFSLTACSKEQGVIHTVSREDGSGTRGAFVELFHIVKKYENGNIKDETTVEAIIINKTDVMLSNVASDTNAVGYVSYGSLNNTVKAVAVENIYPTSESMRNGSYAIVRPFIIVTKERMSLLGRDFILYINSNAAQKVIANGYISVNKNAPPFQSTFPEGKIVITGSSSVNPIMEKLVEDYLKINTQAHIEILVSDSSSGIQNTLDDTCDIGMVSRNLKETELGELIETQFALDGIVIIISPENPIDSLTKEQIHDIFTGELNNWNDLIED